MQEQKSEIESFSAPCIVISPILSKRFRVSTHFTHSIPTTTALGNNNSYERNASMTMVLQVRGVLLTFYSFTGWRGLIELRRNFSWVFLPSDHQSNHGHQGPSRACRLIVSKLRGPKDTTRRHAHYPMSCLRKSYWNINLNSAFCTFQAEN